MYLVTGTWDQGTITWNNQPAAQNLIAAYTVTTAGSDVTIDVTDQVIAALAAADPSVSIVITSTVPGSNNFVNYGSKENTNSSYRPALLIN
ncbi:hypothetical protein D3C84_1202620 [compost metagenome]